MKIFIRILIACSLFLSSSAFSRYIYIKQNTYNYAEFSYRGESFRDSFNNYARILDKNSQLSASINHMERDIRNQVRKAIQNRISGKASLRRLNLSVDRPQSISLEGLSTGAIKITVKDLRLTSDFKVEKGVFNGYGDIETNRFSLTGKYDPISGRVYGLELDDGFDIDVDFDFNSPVDFLIPALDSLFMGYFSLDGLIDGKISTFEKETKESITDGLNSALNNSETVIFGLDESIPHNTFIYQGKDYRDELIDGIKNLISGERLDIKTYDGFDSAPPAKGTSPVVFSSRSNNRVEITFNRGFTFKFYRQYLWEKIWRPDPDDCNPGCPLLP